MPRFLEEPRREEPQSVSTILLDVLEDIESAYEPDCSKQAADLNIAAHFATVFSQGQLIVLSGNSDERNSYFLSELICQLALYGMSESSVVFCRNQKTFTRTLLAQVSGISATKLLVPEWLDDDDWSRLTDALKSLNNAHLLVGEIPANLGLLDAAVKCHVGRYEISVAEEMRCYVFIDNLQSLLDAAKRECESSLATLSSVLVGLKLLAVEMQLQIVVVNSASEAEFAAAQSVIACHANAILTLLSWSDEQEFGREENCTFTMSANGQVLVEPTSLRIDTPM